MTEDKAAEYLRSVRARLQAILLRIENGDPVDHDIRLALRELDAAIEVFRDVDSRPEGDWFADAPRPSEPVGVDSSTAFFNAALRLAVARAGCDDEIGDGSA